MRVRWISTMAGVAALLLALLPVAAGAAAGTVTGTGEHDPGLVDFFDVTGPPTTTDTETVENTVELTFPLERGDFAGTGRIVYRHSVTWHNTPEPCAGVVVTTIEIRYEGTFDPGDNNMFTGTYVPTHQASVQDPVTCPENRFEYRIDESANPWSAQLDPRTGRITEIEGRFLAIIEVDPEAVAVLVDGGATAGGAANGSLTLGEAIGMIQTGSTPTPPHLSFDSVDIFPHPGGCSLIIGFDTAWPQGFGNPGETISDFVLGFQSPAGFSGGLGVFDGAGQEVGDGFAQPPELTDDGRVQVFLPIGPEELVGGGMSLFGTGVMDTHHTFAVGEVSQEPPPEGEPPLFLFDALSDWQMGTFDDGPTDSAVADASEESGGGFPMWILIPILGAVGVGGYLWKRARGGVAAGTPDDADPWDRFDGTGDPASDGWEAARGVLGEMVDQFITQMEAVAAVGGGSADGLNDALATVERITAHPAAKSVAGVVDLRRILRPMAENAFAGMMEGVSGNIEAWRLFESLETASTTAPSAAPSLPVPDGSPSAHGSTDLEEVLLGEGPPRRTTGAPPPAESTGADIEEVLLGGESGRPTSPRPASGGPVAPEAAIPVVGGVAESAKVASCGPDVTVAYLRALNRIATRLMGAKQESVTIHLPGMGIEFLRENGPFMDFWVKWKSDSPCGTCAGCGNDGRRFLCLTFADKCYPAHLFNDTIFGLCAGLLGVSDTIAGAGARFAEYMAYGSGFTAGEEISQRLYPVAAERGRAFERSPMQAIVADEVTAIFAAAGTAVDCPPCGVAADLDRDVYRDFSAVDWTLAGTQFDKPKRRRR